MIKKYSTVILLLVLVLVLFFYKPIFKGLSIVPAETIYHTDHIYTELSLKAKFLPCNGILFDLVFQMYPWKYFLGQSIAKWTMPLWNPYSLAGLPFIANDQSSIFELTKLLSYPLRIPPKDFMLFSSFITLFLAGLFTYLFTENLKLDKTACAVSALAFMFSGPVIVWLGYPLSSVIIWLPFLLLCIDKLVKKKTKLWVSLFALAVGLQFFAGNPEISWFILFLTACYVVFRLYQYKKDYKTLIIKSFIILIALFSGLSLASVQLIPTFEFLKQSSAIREGRGSSRENIINAIRQGEWNVWYSFKDVQHSCANIVLTVYPDFFGNHIYRQYWGASNYNEAAQYIGIIALLFILLSLMYLFKKDNKRKEVIFWFVVSFVCLATYANFPIFRLIAFLPIFKIVAIGRLRYIFVFAMAILSGYGVHYLLNKRGKLFNNIIFINLCYLLITGFIFVIVKKFNYYLPSQIWTIEKLFLLALFILINIGFVLLILQRSILRRIGQILIILIVGSELIFYGYNYHPAIPHQFVYPKMPAIEFLQNNIDNYRFTSYKENTPNFKTSVLPNSSILWGLQDIRGYEIIKIKRYEALEKQFAGLDSRFMYNSFNDKIFNILGVKYFVQGKNDIESDILKQNDKLLVYSDNYINIFENKSVLPRVFMVNTIMSTNNLEESLSLLLDDDFDCGTIATVEGLTMPIDFGSMYDSNSYANIVDYQPNQVEIEVKNNIDSFLVLTDTYYKGWKAYIDGQETEIYPTNAVFRGIFVPQGEHEIKFIYCPKSFIYSMCISIISLIFLILLMSYDKVKKIM